ncbi:hypothetical protein RHSIM_Rhsim02G0131600 [Rhododendron simsii]|uniref:Uncharacterized protein n=1 Tax=Rhododendron simsii TaxID=118357 RepID=A0A834LTK4_RHOSS|nr:hypothetical protein RHSIM_Rhsim02G0131600 [Rhododendron simsii]
MIVTENLNKTEGKIQLTIGKEKYVIRVEEEEESFRFIPPSKNTMIAGSSSGEEDDDVDLNCGIRPSQMADSEHGTRSIPITQEQEQNMIDNELRTTVTAGVTLGIDFEEEDVMSVREMIEGEVQEFARLRRNRFAPLRRNI